MRYFCLVLVFLTAVSATGATPVGSVTASGSFALNGVPITAMAARSIPLVSGDEVQTGDAAATVVLSDRSRVTAGAHASFRVGQSGDYLTVRLTQGALRFSAAPASRLRILALDREVRPQPQSEGTVTVDEQNKGEAKIDQGSAEVEEKQTGKKSWLSRRKAIVFVAVGAGAATGAGIAVGRAPASVEPVPVPPRSGSNP
ncbi:MAG: hypothetical protein HY238_11310 [Acidobacteria bacterium]|nr:hypothetical protein [Acidobacteriota bacterium]